MGICETGEPGPQIDNVIKLISNMEGTSHEQR